MTTMYIKLNSVDVVKNFVNELTKIEGEFDFVSGRYVIDARSIMGIFSLDLSKPLQLNIINAKDSDIEKLKSYC